ncbi:MAG: ABC transporter ATP-binding protein, partial [Acholeplasmataceae bacterium]|nr:ABC transporter ATP-binding protein [Acholeplasmataceae bacterium]
MMYAGKQGRGRNDGSQKAKNKKYVIRRLWDYLYFYKGRLIFALFLTIVANVLSLIGPYLTGRTIASMENGVNFEQVFFFAGLMIVFYLISSLLSYILAVSMVKISKNVVYKMRKDLFEKLNKVPVSYFDQNQT